MQRALLSATCALAALLELQIAAASSLPQQIPFTLQGAASTASYLPPSHLNILNDENAIDEMLVRLTFPKELEDGRGAADVVDELESAGYDVWQRKPEWIDFRCKVTDVIEKTYKKHAANIEVIMPSIRQTIQRERESQETGAKALVDSVHSIYHSLSGIESLLQLFASDYPDYARLQEIGKSAEGKSIYAISISDYREKRTTGSFRTWREYSANAASANKENKGGKKHKGKLGFALIGGQHAREWISPAALLYVAHDLLVQANNPDAPNHEDIVTALQDFEYHFMPVINPDGYEYSWTTDRLWTKNRQYTTSNDTRCHGIDLNRNWGYKFSKAMRPNPCSDLYTGNEAFDAVELDVVSKWLRQKKHETGLQVFLDVHSFGQMLMYPYSYSCTAVPPDAENLYEALIGAGKALKSLHHQTYDVGSVCDVSYTATGQSLDWTYHDLGAKWSFAINLRDQGVYAFLLPPEYIIETGQEFLAGILDLSRFIAQKEKIEN